MNGTAVVAVILGSFLAASTALGQEGQWQEAAVQGTGLFTKNSNGDAVQQHTIDTGGFLAKPPLSLRSLAAADASYG